MNAKHVALFLFSGCIVILSLVLVRYYYRQNEQLMHQQAATLFVDMLKGEFEKKKKELDLPVFSFQQTATDTVSLSIRIKTAKGERKYKVDPEKSRRNISPYMNERFLSSVVCEKNPLLVDSLQVLWGKVIREHWIDALSSIHLLSTDLYGNTTSMVSLASCHSSFYQAVFTSYIGCRCEVEVKGVLHYSWWTVCLYQYAPFLWIIIGSILAVVLFHLFYLLTHRPPKIKVIEKEIPSDDIVEREVIREVVIEKEVIKWVKSSESKKGCSYQLHPELFFDPQKQVLLWNGEEIFLAPQSCVILKLFLDAPDYTMSDEEILKGIWGNDKAATTKRFTVAYSRLCAFLERVNCPVAFKRVGSNQYRMLFIDNQ